MSNYLPDGCTQEALDRYHEGDGQTAPEPSDEEIEERARFDWEAEMYFEWLQRVEQQPGAIILMTHNCHHLNRADQNQALFTDQNAPARPLVARHAKLLPTPVAPYSSIIEVDCDECGGTGSANGKEEEYEPCGYCGGSRKQATLKNWLVEAFQIESGELNANPQIEHLRALSFHLRQVTNAYMEIQTTVKVA
jgi:endogenous inhibitor of DNA gyrase (YacG/DUF329 family)